jgi:hypothetical protein
VPEESEREDPRIDLAPQANVYSEHPRGVLVISIPMFRIRRDASAEVHEAYEAERCGTEFRKASVSSEVIG